MSTGTFENLFNQEHSSSASSCSSLLSDPILTRLNNSFSLTSTLASQLESSTTTTPTSRSTTSAADTSTPSEEEIAEWNMRRGYFLKYSKHYRREQVKEANKAFDKIFGQAVETDFLQKDHVSSDETIHAGNSSSMNPSSYTNSLLSTSSSSLLNCAASPSSGIGKLLQDSVRQNEELEDADGFDQDDLLSHSHNSYFRTHLNSSANSNHSHHPHLHIHSGTPSASHSRSGSLEKTSGGGILKPALVNRTQRQLSRIHELRDGSISSNNNNTTCSSTCNSSIISRSSSVSSSTKMRRVSFSDEVINLQLTSAGTHQYTTTSLSRGASREVTLSRLGNNNNVDEENPEAACVDDLYSKPVRQTDAAVVTAAAVVAVDDRDDNQKAGHEGPASSSSSNLRGLFSRGISKLFK